MKISTLGPEGTFSDQATQKYIKGLNESCDIEYFGSIKLVLKSIGNPNKLAIIPIENFSEGYISPVLDHLVSADVEIIGELYLPIQFSCVGNLEKLQDLESLYVQFVAKGQCSDFIETLSTVKIEHTESNIESLELASQQGKNSAAIVPSNAIDTSEYPFVLHNVTDYENNKTRFVILSSKSALEPDTETPHKTSIVVLDDNDRPGILSEILLSFANRQINLTSITSRPSMVEFGKYHFFIDFEGSMATLNVIEAVEEIRQLNNVKILGSYPSAAI